MALENDDIFGVSYLTSAAFTSRAGAFGAKKAIAGLSAAELTALLAQSSRQIDQYCGRTFDGEPILETYRWPQRGNAFFVKVFPITDIVSCVLHRGKNLTPYTFVLTPTDTDAASRKYKWGNLTYLHDQNQLVIDTSGLTIGSMTGNGYPFIELKYLSTGGENAMPPDVAAACGWQAAYLALSAKAEEALPGGLTSLTTGDRSVSRSAASGANNPNGETGLGLCPQAVNLIRKYKPLLVA